MKRFIQICRNNAFDFTGFAVIMTLCGLLIWWMITIEGAVR